MLIRITNKVNEKLKIQKLPRVELKSEPGFFEEWYVNSLMINRKSYLIFTERVSLFSIIKYAKGINSPDKFETLFTETINEILSDLVPELKNEDYPKSNVVFSKTENGSILKNQCDQIYHAKRYAEEGVNTFQINRIPLKAIGFRFPVDVFINEMQKMLIHKGFIWVSDILKN